MSGRRIPSWLLLAAFLTSVLAGWSTTHAGPEPALNEYRIVATLDYASATLVVHQEVAYRNRSSVGLDSIVFNVTPAFFDAFSLESAAVEDSRATARLDGVSLEVSLPATLQPGAATNVILDYRLTVPGQSGRLGVGGGIIALGNWFPVLSVYRDGLLAQEGRSKGWDRHPYVDTGDAFFTEVADFEIALDTSVPVTLAHTGTLIRREGNRWEMSARGVRDFAMVLSAGFERQTAVVDGITVEAFFLPAHRSISVTYLDAAQRALSWLGQTIMPYPFDRLAVAEVFSTSSTAVGQEYPHLLMISSSVNSQGGAIDSYLSYLVIHEVAHQWFYGIVGDDQIYDPWLDEAVVTWLTLHFYRANHPALFPGMWRTRLVNLLDMLPRSERAKPVNSSIYDFPDDTYYYGVVYRKGALFIEDLYQALGEEVFFAALREYASTYSGRVATPSAFFDTFQAHTRTSVNQLCAGYFTYERCQGGEPLLPQVDWPAAPTWSGTVDLAFTAAAPLTEIRVYAGDHPLAAGAGPYHLTVDTRSLPDGDYVLTLEFKSADGRTAQLARRVNVVNQGEAPAAADPPVPAVTLPGTPEIVDPGGGHSGDSRVAETVDTEAQVTKWGLPGSAPAVAAVVGGGGLFAAVGWVVLQMHRPRHRRH